MTTYSWWMLTCTRERFTSAVRNLHLGYQFTVHTVHVPPLPVLALKEASFVLGLEHPPGSKQGSRKPMPGDDFKGLQQRQLDTSHLNVLCSGRHNIHCITSVYRHILVDFRMLEGAVLVFVKVTSCGWSFRQTP